MKNTYGLAGLLLGFAIAFLLAAPFAEAQSAFDGTWHADESQTTFSSDAKMVVLLQNGMFDCKFSPACTPEIQIKADGTDQPVSDNPSFDMASVRELSQNSITLTMKKDGKTVGEQTQTVSDDGNALTVRNTDHPPNSPKPRESVVTLTRTAAAPSRANKISGTWRPTSMHESENALIFTLKSNGDGLDSTNGVGASWSAKFDGKDYPVAGGAGNVTVSLRRIDDHTFESTTKVDGKPSGVRTFTVSNDGKKMTDVVRNPRTGVTVTYILDKQ